jgi:hypothetical protein
MAAIETTEVVPAKMMTGSWSEIRRHYAHRPDRALQLAPMLKLVTAIESSRYASGLFAWTSVWDLCIAQAPVAYPYSGPYLRISQQQNNKVEFRYIDSPIGRKQWSRTVEGTDAFARLESFLKQLNWFVTYEVSTTERRETR